MSNVKQLIIDDTIISDDKFIAESFNECFINVGINIGTESEQFYEIPSDDQIPESGLDHSPNIRFKFANINVSNVAMNLSNLKVSKATGMDNLPAKILKISSYLIAPSLTAIFNMSLKSGIYMDEWKMARVIPIYKSENRSKCENYRPISILPIISKVFEREVFNQIYRYLNENSLISKFQSGFRPKYGTVSALIQMCDQWLTDMDNGN